MFEVLLQVAAAMKAGLAVTVEGTNQIQRMVIRRHFARG